MTFKTILAAALAGALAQGLAITGHFLARHIFEPRGVSAPEQRQRIARWLDQTD